MLKCGCFALGLAWAFTQPVAAAETIGEKMVAYCKSHLGEKVGNGQCTALAEQALRAAGAKPRIAKDSPNSGDYVWGELAYVIEFKDGALKEQKIADNGIQPGDVIQLRDARFRSRTNYTKTAPHHTAVVKEVKGKGKVLVILEQNFNGKMIVTEGDYRLNDLKAGWLRIYRPVAK